MQEIKSKLAKVSFELKKELIYNILKTNDKCFLARAQVRITTTTKKARFQLKAGLSLSSDVLNTVFFHRIILLIPLFY